MADNSKTLSIYDDLQLPLGSVRRSYLVKFVDPSKEYDVDYLAPHQSRIGLPKVGEKFQRTLAVKGKTHWKITVERVAE